MTGTITPYRSALRPGRDGFGQLLRAEWTKFRTVRGWVVGTVAAGVVMLLLGLLVTAGNHASICTKRGSGPPTCHGALPLPVGPGGEAVVDTFSFVHRPLVGDGSLTVRVASLTGVFSPGGRDPLGRGGAPATDLRSGVQPWAKAGLMVKASLTQGSTYAAVMVTGGHGVRMQYDYTHDVAGRPGTVTADSPRWLRLTRSGDTLTGEESSDGGHWTRVGTAHLAGLPSTVQVGLFVASPDKETFSQQVGGTNAEGGPTRATAAFDHVALDGQAAGGAWRRDQVGDGGEDDRQPTGGFSESGGTFRVTGSGDIVPAGSGPPSPPGMTVETSLFGAFGGLIAVIVVAALFLTAEYRRGLIRTTLAASPRRGRVLLAKAVVVGAVTFVVGLVASAVAFAAYTRLLRANGNYLLPVSSLTEVRLVVGTAALIAGTAVLALAIGAVLRRGVRAVTAVVMLVVLPYILAVGAVLPAGPAEWLLRITPAAAFAVQQSLPAYPQVDSPYTPALGYFPLPPWAGLAVLGGYVALALGLAAVVLHRRDA